jgi:hypothetical protein
MPKLPTWAWILIAIAAVYLIYRGMGKASQYNGTIKIAYDKIGQAMTSGVGGVSNVVYNWTNPGR